MTPREHQRLRFAAVEGFGDTSEVAELLARYEVVPELAAAPRESYEAAHVRARLDTFGACARRTR